MSKPGTVCKDMLTCFHLAISIWILGILCREKVLSILSNESMVKNSSSCSSTWYDLYVREPTTTLGVAGLKVLAILIFKSEEIVYLNSRIGKGYSLSI